MTPCLTCRLYDSAYCPEHGAATPKETEMQTIPWYKSETLIANLFATTLFGLGLVQQAARDGVDLGSGESWAYIIGLVVTLFTFVQRTWFTTKIVEQSANRGGG